MGSIMMEFQGAPRKVVRKGTAMKTKLIIAGRVLGWLVLLMLAGLATLIALNVMMTSANETGVSMGLAALLFIVVCVCFLWMAWLDAQRGWIHVLGLPRTALMAIAAWGLVCIHVLSRADALTTPAGYVRLSTSDGHLYPSSERVTRGFIHPVSFPLVLRTDLHVKWQQGKSQCDFFVSARIEPGPSLERFVLSNRIWNVGRFEQAARTEISVGLLSSAIPDWVAAMTIRSSSCQYGNRT